MSGDTGRASTQCCANTNPVKAGRWHTLEGRPRREQRPATTWQQHRGGRITRESFSADFAHPGREERGSPFTQERQSPDAGPLVDIPAAGSIPRKAVRMSETRGDSTHKYRGPRRDAQQKQNSAHERGQGDDSSGGTGGAKCPARARVGNAHGNTPRGETDGVTERNGRERTRINKVKETREAGRL